MSFQETLGEGDGVAAELAESQREISIAEFFERNKHMLGFDSGARGLVTAVKEAVDNALDAAEEADILPDVYVEITERGEYYRLVVEDNGPGITRAEVPKVFGKLLYGSRFHKREQNRGQQGIGISAAVLYSQLTSGKPATVISRPKGAATARKFELTIDTDTNEPEIASDEETSWERPQGTRIELEMEANMRARSQLHDYVEHTAVVNPHARIELREPEAHLKFERATDQLPAETEEIRPHPHGVELGTLQKLLDATDSYSVSGFVQEEFTRVGQKTADDIVDAFRDRHYGREMAWRSPGGVDDVDLRAALEEAVANKTAAATADFADRVATVLAERERISHGALCEIVANVADGVEDEHGETFGDTVRANAVEAAWAVTIREPRLVDDATALVDEATSTRKSDATVEGLGERLAEQFLAMEDSRHRRTRETLADVVDRVADLTADATGESIGETARENVVAAVWSRMHTVADDPPGVKTVAGDRDMAADLLSAMDSVDIMAPPTNCLAPITAELIEAGLKKEVDADFYAATTRDAGVHGGDPFIVEAGVAYGGELEEDGPIDLMRFANRVPLVYQRGACATTDVVRSINWRNYNLDQPGGTGMPNGPCAIVIHVASTNVPFTSESKDAVANVPEIETEIERALREVGRELKAFLNRRQSMQKRRRKRDNLATILPEMAEKLSEVTGREPLDIDDSLARIMNNVLVERERDGTTVTITVENNGDTTAGLELTDIVSAAPELNGTAASVVEVDGEWFLSWEVTVDPDDRERLRYELDRDATAELTVEGVPEAKLTIDA
ncbi:MAG: DNA topoisomerase VI subunit B [Halobacteriaceae archaeon]